MALQQKGNFAGPTLDSVMKDRLGFIGASWIQLKRASEIKQSIPSAPFTKFLNVPHTRTDVSAQDGVATISWIYEGLAEEPRGTDAWIFEFEPSFDEVPIQAHPNFDYLFKTYGGKIVNGQLEWSPMTEAAAQGSGLNSSAPLNSRNPMEGVEGFLRMGGVWRVIYAKLALPGNLFQGVGSIVGAVPEGRRLPALPAGRNWMKAPPRCRWRGNAWEVTEEYILSGIGGHNRVVYDGKTEGGTTGGGFGGGIGLTGASPASL